MRVYSFSKQHFDYYKKKYALAKLVYHKFYFFLKRMKIVV